MNNKNKMHWHKIATLHYTFIVIDVIIANDFEFFNNTFEN